MMCRNRSEDFVHLIRSPCQTYFDKDILLELCLNGCDTIGKEEESYIHIYRSGVGTIIIQDVVEMFNTFYSQYRTYLRTLIYQVIGQI